MMSAFGVDVLDPAVSPRRIWVLANRLPPWARSGGEPWSVESHLTALLIDHVANLTWVTLRAAGARSAAKPRPVPRPRTTRPGPGRAPGALRAPQGAKSAGWGDAIRQLAAIPGVVVSGD